VARRRTFDGTKIYNEAWEGATRDVFFYLLGVAADNFGMLKENAGLVASVLGISARRGQQSIDYLVGEEVLLRYGDNGSPYLIFRKWQDYQKVKYPGSPSCPLPPPHILGKLSRKSREHLLGQLGSDSGENGRAVAVAVADDSEAHASAPNPKQASIEHFFRRLQQHTGLEAPEFPGGQAAGFFTRRLRKGDTLEDLRETIDEFFDGYIKGDKSAANFAHYQRVYNALCIAVQKRRGKGANRRA
jgi:hypothetical protein